MPPIRRPSRNLAASASLITGLLWCASAGASEPLAEAARAMEEGSYVSFLRAATFYEEHLDRHPEDDDARVAAAHALNSAMAIRTNGNLPTLEGLQDSVANRAIWADLGERALDHARAGRAGRPDSAVAAERLATAYMFYSSSMGILQAILAGAGTEYREHANRLLALDPEYEDAIADFLLANFYLVAPWPIGDGDEARAHFEQAEARAPASVRNQYGLGIFWGREGEEERAAAHFERAIALPCTANSERLFCDFMKTESQRSLKALTK